MNVVFVYQVFVFQIQSSAHSRQSFLEPPIPIPNDNAVRWHLPAGFAAKPISYDFDCILWGVIVCVYVLSRNVRYEFLITVGLFVKYKAGFLTMFYFAELLG